MVSNSSLQIKDFKFRTTAQAVAQGGNLSETFFKVGGGGS